jgi:putative ABC transport system permease protein
MFLASSLFFAWQAMTRQRLRSFLAVLGVTVGALAVVSVLSVEQSWREQVDRAFTGLDLNRFYVDTPRTGKGLARTQLIEEDGDAIRRECDAVDRLTVYTFFGGNAHRGRQRVDYLNTWWIDSDFEDVFGLSLLEGALLTRHEIEQGAQLCMITPELAKVLFPEGKSVGKQLRVADVPFTVAGVVARVDDPDWSKAQCVYLPRRSFRLVNRSKPSTSIRGRAKDPAAAARQIDALMRRRVGGDRTTEYVQGAWIAREAARNVRNRAQLVGVLAAICALLLGSYGVAAVLYVSVAESAREIGVRRALGAGRLAAASEVMLAGAIFGLVGAAAGLVLAKLGLWLAAVPGVMIPQGFDRAFRELAGPGGPQGIPSFFIPTMSWQPVVTATVSSLLMCVFASLEPASEIVKLDPAYAVAHGLAPARGLRLGLAVAQVTIAVAAIALLPSLYESLDQADTREMRGVFRANAIDVSLPFPGGGNSVQTGTLPVAWYRDAQALEQAYADPQFSRKLLRSASLLTSAEPEVFGPGMNSASIKAESRVLSPVLTDNPRSARVEFVNPSFYPTETGPAGPELAGHGEIRHGRFFTEEMVRSRQRVCVLDTEAAALAYGESNGVGRTVRVNGIPFRVVGAMAGGYLAGYHGEGFYGRSGVVFLPLGLYRELRPVLLSGAHDGAGGEAPLLTVRVKDETRLPQAAAQLREALIGLLPKGLGKRVEISQSLPGSLRDFMALRAATAKRSAFCSLALLLVALIGLANTLLVSLSQQAREVGIRRALGAQKWQVMAPLLTEGLGLAAAGAVLGGAFAAVVSWGMRMGIPSQRFFTLSPFWALAAGLAMVLTSLLVSLLPGVLATRVDPAQALHQE